MGTARAPGKIIVAGEHFVVHGAPALAVPLHARGVTVTVAREARPWALAPAVAEHVRRCLEALGEDPGALAVEVASDLPVGAGLGGSAALAVALVRALAGPGADPAEVRERAHALERIAHGRPSGIDDAVAAWACPVWLVRGEALEVLADAPQPRLWVGVTPERTSTREAVAGVGAFAEAEPRAFADLMARARRVAHAARAALFAEDWPALGAAMTDNHGLLQAVGVSTPGLDGLVDAARAAGAHGAKLTGGGRGGAAIALAPEGLDLGPAWRAAGAVEVIAP